MAMSTKTLRGETKAAAETEVSVDAILAEQQNEQRQALAQAKLYRSLVYKAAEGKATQEDTTAAQIIGKKWNWNYDEDFAAVQHCLRIATMFPNGTEEGAKELWEKLTAKAKEKREYTAEYQAKLHTLELERSAFEQKHSVCCQYTASLKRYQKSHPHLFSE